MDCEEWRLASATLTDDNKGDNVMIEILKDYPENVLAVEGVGRVTAEDYRNVLIPEALNRMAKHEHVRLYCELGERFDGLTAGAAWEDMKLGVSRWKAFGRLAVVTDTTWIKDAVRLFAPFFHHPVRTFPTSQREAARDWILAEEDAS
jgi:hypothetical protein